MIGSKDLPGLISSFLEVNDHETAHEARGVGLLCIVQGGVVVYLILRVLSISHQFLKFLAEQVHLTKIKWPEVGKKWFIDEVVVDAEIKGV